MPASKRRPRAGTALWVRVGSVESDSEPGVRHEIKQHADGRRGCDCMAYRFARGEKTCKHLEAFSWQFVEHSPHPPLRKAALPTEQVNYRGESFTVRRSISFGGQI